MSASAGFSTVRTYGEREFRAEIGRVESWEVTLERGHVLALYLKFGGACQGAIFAASELVPLMRALRVERSGELTNLVVYALYDLTSGWSAPIAGLARTSFDEADDRAFYVREDA